MGAVGEPRDDDWRASYALFDGEYVQFRRVPYDVETTRERIREAGLHEFLADRLLVGQQAPFVRGRSPTLHRTFRTGPALALLELASVEAPKGNRR